MGAITRNGGVLNFPTTTATFTTTSVNNSAGILGSYLTVNYTDWAAVSGGTIGALASYNTDDYTSATTNNVDVTDGALAPTASAMVVNSLRFAGTASLALASTSTLTLGSGTLGSGGILVSPHVARTA